MKLAVTIGATKLHIELRDTPTARALVAAVPFESRAQTWGEEVYFGTPVSVPLEADARQVVEPGSACFWTEGDAIALPFGRTPISTDERPKLASRCNLFGNIAGPARALAAVKSGDPIKVEVA
jgi:hypothetical protein